MRRLVLIAVLIVLAAIGAQAAWAVFTTHAKATAKFKIADAGDVDLNVSEIEGALLPGESLSVKYRIANPGGWSIKIGRVLLDEPGITGLPDGCPQKAFDWSDPPIKKVLDGGEHVDGSGKLSMAKNVPTECAGAEPVLHLRVTAVDA